jgi:glycosyltransferase involved in cell wall biosynthesis
MNTKAQALPTVTIGIPAYNEASNIIPELTELLRQEHKNYTLTNILIYSDGSTDQTTSLIKRLNSPVIKVISASKRQGKPHAINTLFRLSQADIFVLLDADLKIINHTSIDALIKPLSLNPKMQLSSGLAIHQTPTNFTERLAFSSNAIWEKAITYPARNEMYFCSGSIRAFGKLLYKRIKFANYSADDAYAYIACKKLGYDFAYTKQVQIIQKLPTNLKDFFSQSTRFIQSQNIQNTLFAAHEVEQYYVVTWSHKLRAVLWYLPHDPIATILYLFFRLWLSIITYFSQGNTTSLWEIATSTKKRL